MIRQTRSATRKRPTASWQGRMKRLSMTVPVRISAHVKLGHALLECVQPVNFLDRERPVEEGQVVDHADVVAGAEPNVDLFDVPTEVLVHPTCGAPVLGVEVKPCPTGVRRVDTIPGDRHVGPLSPGERRLRDLDEAKVELGTLRLLAGDISLGPVAKESKAELWRRVVLREIDPDARIAEVLVRDLEGVAVLPGISAGSPLSHNDAVPPKSDSE